MSEDLRNAIIAAIAGEADPNTKKLLLLLLRIEEVFIQRVDMLAQQLTVPADKHASDHVWIDTHRSGEGNVKAALWKISVGLLEKGALVAAGAIAARFFS